MRKTAEETGHFRGQFRTRSGFKISASFERAKDGGWKIFSIGGVGVPTSFLPYEILNLVYSGPFSSLDDAKWAVKAA